jgi:hypothetical protein
MEVVIRGTYGGLDLAIRAAFSHNTQLTRITTTNNYTT